MSKKKIGFDFNKKNVYTIVESYYGLATDLSIQYAGEEMDKTLYHVDIHCKKRDFDECIEVAAFLSRRENVEIINLELK